MEMLNKYKREKQRLDDSISFGLKQNQDRSILLQKLRQRKVVMHYINQCEKRINYIMEKHYAVEQLKLLAMQIEALRETATVFESFTKQNNIEKIEELQDNMEELTSQVMAVNDTIGSEPLVDEFSDEDLLKELESFDTKSTSIVEIVENTLPLVPINNVTITCEDDTSLLLQ